MCLSRLQVTVNFGPDFKYPLPDNARPFCEATHQHNASLAMDDMLYFVSTSLHCPPRSHNATPRMTVFSLHYLLRRLTIPPKWTECRRLPPTRCQRPPTQLYRTANLLKAGHPRQSPLRGGCPLPRPTQPKHRSQWRWMVTLRHHPALRRPRQPDSLSNAAHHH